jgi:predicted alpha/beta hydrolase
MVKIATSSGYTGGMLLRGKLRAIYFFEIIRPLVHFLYGYTQVKSYGIMEDMPKNVTNAWRDWCSNSPYFFHKDYVKKIE